MTSIWVEGRSTENWDTYICRWNENVNRWPKATETFYPFLWHHPLKTQLTLSNILYLSVYSLFYYLFILFGFRYWRCQFGRVLSCLSASQYGILTCTYVHMVVTIYCTSTYYHLDSRNWDTKFWDDTRILPWTP